MSSTSSSSRTTCAKWLVTPKTEQSHFAQVVRLLDEVLDTCRPDSVVVNDLGLLHYLKGRDIDVTLGRVLAGSFGYRASMDAFLHPHETPDVVANTLAPTILHRKKIELYKNYGVTAIEICPMRNEHAYIERLQDYGLRIHVHYASFISAMSKICYTLDMNGGGIPTCALACKKPQKLKLEHIANYNPTSSASMLEEEFKSKQVAFPDYFLAGNVIHHIEEKRKITRHCYDTVIYDYRYFHSRD